MAIENNKFEHENELDRVDLQIKGEQKEDSILDNQI